MEGIFIFTLIHVRKTFGERKKTIAIDDVSFSFPSKGIFAIGGKSGSGKSTLLNLLSLLTKPTSGKILFLGKDLASLNKKERLFFRNCVCGFVHQKFNLLEKEDVLTNIMIPRLIYGDSFKKAKEKAQFLLTQFDLISLQKRRVSSLSGGEKQRVAIMRSLINDSSVLFCDEPTGALDEKNSLLIMETLEKIGKEKLVILVSHNQKMVDRFASYSLTLKDGKMIEEAKTFLNEEALMRPVEKQSSSFWKRMFVLHHLKEDKKRNILSFLSNVIAFAFLLCSLGFIYGSDGSLTIEKEKTMLLYQGSISKKETFSLANSPLSLTRSSRPLKEETYKLIEGTNISVHNDYSYFFPRVATFKSNDVSSHASFEPIFDFSLKELGEDWVNERISLHENEGVLCYVNDVFYHRFSLGVGEKVYVPMKVNVTLGKENSIVTTSNEFVIAGVIKEFGFLNTPRVYYSYGSLEERLKKTFVKVEGGKKSVYSLVEEATGDDAFSSYSYLLFAHDEEGKKELFSLVDSSKGQENGLEVSSYSHALIESFDSLHGALSGVLFPFLLLALFASSFVSGSISFSSFLERKKEAAILTSLGAPFSSLLSIYISESLIVGLSSTFVSLILGYFLEMILNPLLLALSGIPSLIQIPYWNFLGMPFLLPLLSFLLSIVLSFVGTFIPIATFNRNNLIKELNDE